ncbi:transport and Golgi organization protein 6 homolog isoform X2 [Ylistrum balloti]|uniref:transport and Golgi organization protein 6 homolog isoform X2 n=1 Tax=Ylistrum balloti TaxID=509963 RepID=UPI002905A492|nr:transport and Golgi organization protein 6 homolog isoform X2 [Ylistrum balloti]
MNNNEEQIRLVLKLLEALTSPDKTKSDKMATASNNTEENGFDLLLKTNLTLYRELLKTDKYQNLRIMLDGSVPMETGIDTCRWHFVCACLETLTMLQKSISIAMEEFTKKIKENPLPELRPGQAPPLSPDNLSIGHHKMVLTTIQFVVILGISPKLDFGVGIPMERRSEFAKLLLESSKPEQTSKESRNVCLFSCIRVFMTLLDIPSIAGLLLSRHLNDLLASLLMLLHGFPNYEEVSGTVKDEKSVGITTPESKVDSSSLATSIAPSQWTPASVVDMVIGKQSNSADKEDLIVVDKESSEGEEPNEGNCPKEGSSDKEYKELHRKEPINKTGLLGHRELHLCETWLQLLLEKAHPQMLVRELLLLQSGAPAPPKQVGTSKKKWASPVWLRKVCGRLLTNILMKPKGVIHVLQGMLEGPGREKGKSTASDWKKCDAVARVIACCPMSSASVEDYYALVSPQILLLLHHPDSQVCQEFLRVACTTIARMMAQQPDLTRKYLLSPLMEPLERCSELKAITPEKQRLVQEKELTTCLEDLYKVFVSGCEPSTPLMTCLVPVSHTIFFLLCYTKKGVSHLSRICEEILVSLLKALDKEEAIACLHQWILQTEQLESRKTDNEFSLTKTHPDVRFSAGDSGGVTVFINSMDSNHGDEGAVTTEMMTAAAVAILKELEKNGLTGDFFLALLMELTDIINQEIHGDISLTLNTKQDRQDLMEAEIREKQIADSFQRKVSVLNLLAAICEEIGPSCLKNTQQTLKFVQVTLERGVQVCKNTCDDILGAFESETLTMAMGMLTAVLTGTIKITEDDREYMKKLMPLLEDISSNHPDNTIQEMASDLRVAIATHGVIWSELLKSSAKGEKQQKFSSKESQSTEEFKPDKKPLVEVISETSEEYLPKPPLSLPTLEQVSSEKKIDAERKSQKHTASKLSTGTGKESMEEMSALCQAFEELHDPLIPVRGHALITMNKLIQKKDPEAVEKMQILLNVFKENLHHPDSYLYLSSVNGLVSLVDKFPDVVIPVLTEEFLAGTNGAQSLQGERTRQANDRIKVGECLVQTSRKLGDMAPHYRDKLLTTFLQGCKDVDPLIRASSLSNLGELCKVLRFSVGNYIHLILNCACVLLKSDPSTEVRQAAAMMVSLQLEGLGKDLLKVLESAVRDLYRTLRQCMVTEKEDSVKMQITVALNTLDSITREVMFPTQTLEKKIRILDTN